MVTLVPLILLIFSDLLLIGRDKSLFEGGLRLHLTHFLQFSPDRLDKHFISTPFPSAEVSRVNHFVSNIKFWFSFTIGF